MKEMPISCGVMSSEHLLQKHSRCGERSTSGREKRNTSGRQQSAPSDTSVSALQRNQSIALKEEYHAFRDRVAMLLVVLAGLLSTGLAYSQSRAEKSARFTLTPPFMVGVQVYLCWVLYSYTAMALRENVLKVRGRVHAAGCSMSMRGQCARCRVTESPV